MCVDELQWNYVISAAFSCGIAITALIIFFALEIPHGGVTLAWWGNNIVYEGCEAASSPCRAFELAKGEYFGPRMGEFH